MIVRFALLVVLAGFGVVGCSPEVGTPAWCESMDEKAKGDWSANEAADYAKNCIFRSDDSED